MPVWMKHKLESRLPGEISTTSDMQITPLIAEREEELKSLLMRVKVRSLSRVRLFATPVDCSLPGSSRPEHWSGVPLHSAYKLNKQDNNIQPWCTPFPIGNQSVVPYPVLTVASWPAYRFLRSQVRWSGIPSLSEFSTVYCDPHKPKALA